MKLFDPKSEIRALVSICSGSKSSAKIGKTLNLDISSYLLATLDVSYFHFEPCQAAFTRVLKIAKKRAEILSFDELLTDLAISEEYRDILQEHKRPPVKNMEAAKALVSSLGNFRKSRILYFSAKSVIDLLKGGETDLEVMLDSVANSVAMARTGSGEVDPIHVFGEGFNSPDLFDQALDPSDEILLKTGFKDFDDKNGGLPSEGVMLLGGTTSGGKSVIRMVLLANMYKLNRISVATVSFEMNAKKEIRRLLSFLTGIDFWKFVRKRLTKDERIQCKAAWDKFIRFGEKNGCRYALMCPTRGLTINQTLMLVKPYGFKVLSIDYVSLLDGVDEDNQPRMLKAITRECKMYSGENKCLIVLLVQVDGADSRIRYSKGMLEDADNCVVGRTLVSTPTGMRRVDCLVDTDSDLVENSFTEFKVVSEGEVQTATAWAYLGYKHTRKIETENGFHIRCTEDHRIKTNLDCSQAADWEKAINIKPGDYIAIDYRNPKGDTLSEAFLLSSESSVYTESTARFMQLYLLRYGVVAKVSLDDTGRYSLKRLNKLNICRLEDGVMPYHWERVVSNVYAGLEKVYDITVPATESFIANGIVVHNCWIFNYDGSSDRDRHVIPVQQRKARDQELFPFDLKEEFFKMKVSNEGSEYVNKEEEKYEEDFEQYEVP